MKRDMQGPIHVQHVPLVQSRTLLVQRTVHNVQTDLFHPHGEQQVVMNVQNEQPTMLVLLSVVSI